MKNTDAAATHTEQIKMRGFFGNLIDRCYVLMDNKYIKWGVYLALLAITIALPLIMNNYWIGVIRTAMLYMLLAMGLNVIVGYTGLVHLGFAANFAVGAYTTGILVKTFGWSFWLTIPAAIVISIVAACLIGGPTLRLRSDYLAVVTLGFGEIIRIAARNLQITGAASGLSGIRRPYFFGIHLTSHTSRYYVFLVLVIIFIFLSNRIKSSRFGRALEYIREDEDAAKAMGVNTTLYKLFAFIVGAVFGGVAGSFFVLDMGAISPNSFQFLMSANILLAVVLGGMGKIPGVILGGAFIAIFPELLRSLSMAFPSGSVMAYAMDFVGSARMLFFGIILVLVMIKRPQGLWPERHR